MNNSSHLTNGKVNLLDLKEWLRREFLTFFEDSIGKKLVVWDTELTGPIGLIAEYGVLKERGVEKMFDLKQIDTLKSRDIVEFEHVYFIVRSKLDLIEQIANHILNIEKEKSRQNSQQKEYHLIFVPRKSLICERKLQEMGVYGTFKDNIKEFCLDLIPLDNDLLSMENNDVYKECYLFDDYTNLFHISKSIMTLQTLYGIIPNIYGKGKCAKIVADMIVNMKRDLVKNDLINRTPKIDNLIIIDRSIDPLTPMMTQLTYEGLIDESFDIRYTSVELPADNRSAPADTASGSTSAMTTDVKRSIVTLNSSDRLFAEIRDKNFNAVSSVLSRTAKELQQAYEQKNQIKSASEMRAYVEKTLKTYQLKKNSLANHTLIAELLKDTTETEEFIDVLKCEQDLLRCFDLDKIHFTIISYIAQSYNFYKIMRLISIHCCVANGFKAKLLETYKKEIGRSYGFKYLELFNNMEKVGLIYTQAAASQKYFQQITKSLRIVVDDVDELEPKDISYVYSGYAPISIRFIENLCKLNRKNIQELIDVLPSGTAGNNGLFGGVYFEENQKTNNDSLLRRNSSTSITSGYSMASGEQKMTLLFFIGGCTYAEISALRFMCQNDDFPTDFIIATTSIINGKKLIRSLDDIN